MTHETTPTPSAGRHARPPQLMSHAAMDEALGAGTAEPLAAMVTDYVRYADDWWLLDATGWIRIPDPKLTATLDRYAARARRGIF